MLKNRKTLLPAIPPPIKRLPSGSEAAVCDPAGQQRQLVDLLLLLAFGINAASCSHPMRMSNTSASCLSHAIRSLFLYADGYAFTLR